MHTCIQRFAHTHGHVAQTRPKLRLHTELSFRRRCLAAHLLRRACWTSLEWDTHFGIPTSMSRASVVLHVHIHACMHSYIHVNSAWACLCEICIVHFFLLSDKVLFRFSALKWIGTSGATATMACSPAGCTDACRCTCSRHRMEQGLPTLAHR